MKSLKFNSFIKNLMTVVLLFLILLASGTPLQSVYNQQISLSLFAFSFIYWCIYGQGKMNQSLFFVVFGMSLLLVLSMLVNRDGDLSHYIGLIVVVFSCCFVVSSLNYSDFEKIFVNIIIVISIYSVILTIYSNINLSFPGTLPVFVGTRSSWHSLGVFYYYWGWTPWSRIVRNSACFREPGVWGCYSCIAFYLHIKNNYNKNNITTVDSDKRKGLINVILFVGIASSLSTTAILGLCVCVLFFLFVNGMPGRKQFILGTLLIMVMGIVLFSFEEILFSKFDETSINNISMTDRMDGVYSGLESFLQNPFLGSGYTYYIQNTVGTSANSFLDIIGKYGLIFLFFIIFGLTSTIKSYHLNVLGTVITWGLFLILLFTQNLLIYPFFLCICMYNYSAVKNKGD